MSTAMKVAARINRLKRGIPFSITGFYTLGSLSSVQKALSRLTKEKLIERVSKGIYVRPKPLKSMPSIKVGASALQVARVWANTHGYKLTNQGVEEAYRLGFQTQAPVKTVLWSNGPSRQFKVGHEIVEIRHITNTKLRWVNHPVGALLRGMSVTPADSVEIPVLQAALKRLSLTKTESLLAIKQLQSTQLVQAWQHKLESLEQTLAA
ncbi:MAG: DUF6088 family protein [Methylococcales bacterium]